MCLLRNICIYQILNNEKINVSKTLSDNLQQVLEDNSWAKVSLKKRKKSKVLLKL